MFCVIRSMLSILLCASPFFWRSKSASFLAFSNAAVLSAVFFASCASVCSRASKSRASSSNRDDSPIFSFSSRAISSFSASPRFDHPESSVSILNMFTLWFSILFLIIASLLSIAALSDSRLDSFSRSAESFSSSSLIPL